ncbi:MAG: hypothetical protein WCJ76_10130, partial [Comamonadaceae bacterium]
KHDAPDAAKAVDTNLDCHDFSNVKTQNSNCRHCVPGLSLRPRIRSGVSAPAIHDARVWMPDHVRHDKLL